MGSLRWSDHRHRRENVWKLWLEEPTGIYELLPAFPAAVAAIVIVSLMANRWKETNL